MLKYISCSLLLGAVFAVPSTSFAAGDVKVARRVSPVASARCHVATKAEVAGLFDRWNKSLRTGNPKKVAANYAPDAVLLPTLSKQVRYTQKQREDYFQGFLKKKPVGHIDSRTVRIGCNVAMDTGTYTFAYGDGSKANARYTFTYAWNGKDWLISSHHSSAMPR